MTTPQPLQRKRMVPVTEERAITRNTVPGLLEAFRDAFDAPFKVERIVYERGRTSFSVERLVPEDSLETPEERGEMATAFQMIRQHADLDVQEAGADPLESVARAVQALTSRGHKLIMFVCENRDLVRQWLKRDLRLEDIWQVPLYEDPDAQASGVFVVGSKTGTLLRDIEAAIMCPIEV